MANIAEISKHAGVSYELAKAWYDYNNKLLKKEFFHQAENDMTLIFSIYYFVKIEFINGRNLRLTMSYEGEEVLELLLRIPTSGEVPQKFVNRVYDIIELTYQYDQGSF